MLQSQAYLVETVDLTVSPLQSVEVTCNSSVQACFISALM